MKGEEREDTQTFASHLRPDGGGTLTCVSKSVVSFRESIPFIVFKFIISNTIKSAGESGLAYSVNLGLRIAHHPKISNVEAHAVKYY